jgi:hypothetical protein
VNAPFLDAKPDPMGLEDLRVYLKGEMARRWTKAARNVKRAIVSQDALGLGPRAMVMASDDRAALFERWLSERLTSDVLGDDGSWLAPYVDAAGARASTGVHDAYVADYQSLAGPPVSQTSYVERKKRPRSSEACKDASVASLASVCDDASRDVSSLVSAWLLSHPRGQASQIAALVDREMGVGLQRSKMLAEHALTQAFTQATLDAYEDAGVQWVGTVSEHKMLDAMFDFDPSEARDPHGRWTAEASAEGYEFVSPNVGQSDWPQATAPLSRRERKFAEASEDVDQQLGMTGYPSQVIGAWADGAERSLMTEVDGEDWDRLKLAGAMKGHLGDQKAVLIFREEEGPESNAHMYSFPAKGDLGKIHQNLLADGLAFHTLEPTSNGAVVHVVDTDGSLKDATAKAAQRYGSDIHWRDGRAEFIGAHKEDGTDREQRDDARREYEGIIARSPVQEGRAVWQRLHHRWSAALAHDALDDLYGVKDALFDDARTSDKDLARLIRETANKPWFKPDIGAERQADLISRLSEARSRLPADASQLARDLMLASTGLRGISVRQAALAERLIGQAGPPPPTPSPAAARGPAEMREKYRSKRTGRFRRYLPIEGLQARAERAEAAFRRAPLEVDVLTAQDDKVCKVCEDIADNGPYRINVARGLIPAHPNCRCLFAPVGMFGDAILDFNPLHEPAGAEGGKGGQFAPKGESGSLAEQVAKTGAGFQQFGPSGDDKAKIDAVNAATDKFEKAHPEAAPEMHRWMSANLDKFMPSGKPVDLVGFRLAFAQWQEDRKAGPQADDTAPSPPIDVAGLDPAVVDVGGDAWNRHTAARLEREWQAAKPTVEADAEAIYKAGKVETGGGARTTWADLTSQQQDEVADNWKHDAYQQELDYQINSWQEESAKADAYELLADEFNHQADNQWPTEALNDLFEPQTSDEDHLPQPSQWEKGGLAPLPLGKDQILNALEARYDHHGGELEFRWAEGAIRAAIRARMGGDQPQFEGFEKPDYAKLLTPAMRDKIVATLKKAMDEVVDERIDQMDPPDYLGEYATESVNQDWDDKDDVDKFAIAMNQMPSLKQADWGRITRPAKLDPLNATSGMDYVNTQRIAKALFNRRAGEILDQRGLIKPGGIKNPTGMVVLADDFLWSDWLDASSTKGGQLLQLAASEELGGRLQSGGAHYSIDRHDVVEWADTNYPLIGGYEGIKALARAKWETTQYLLDHAGMKELNLYRSVTLPEAITDIAAKIEVAVGNLKYRLMPKVDIKKNGLASFSVADHIANNWDGSDRTVIRLNAPRTAILSVPAFGKNTASEQEVVVAGTAWKKWDAYHRQAPSVGWVPIGAEREATKEEMIAAVQKEVKGQHA